jgi:hypothetical protein
MNETSAPPRMTRAALGFVEQHCKPNLNNSSAQDTPPEINLLV